MNSDLPHIAHVQQAYRPTNQIVVNIFTQHGLVRRKKKLHKQPFISRVSGGKGPVTQAYQMRCEGMQ